MSERTGLLCLAASDLEIGASFSDVRHRQHRLDQLRWCTADAVGSQMDGQRGSGGENVRSDHERIERGIRVRNEFCDRCVFRRPQLPRDKAGQLIRDEHSVDHATVRQHPALIDQYGGRQVTVCPQADAGLYHDGHLSFL